MTSIHRLSSFAGLAAIVVVCGLFVASARRARRIDDHHVQQVEVSKIPNSVQAAAKQYFPSLAGCKATVEKKRGRSLFEIQGMGESSMKVSVTLTESGQVVEVERELTADRLPPEARAEIEKRHPGATVTTVDAIETHHFEVEIVDAHGKKSEVECSATGRVTDDEDDYDESGDDDDEQDEEEDR